MVTIANIRFNPKPSSKIRLSEELEIIFDYKIDDGIKTNIWAIGDKVPSIYSASRLHSGKGTLKRFISSKSVGKLREIEIFAKSPRGIIYNKINIPVNYEFIRD